MWFLTADSLPICKAVKLQAKVDAHVAQCPTTMEINGIYPGFAAQNRTLSTPQRDSARAVQWSLPTLCYGYGAEMIPSDPGSY